MLQERRAELVLDGLRPLSDPAQLCPDAAFLRRALEAQGHVALAVSAEDGDADQASRQAAFLVDLADPDTIGLVQVVTHRDARLVILLEIVVVVAVGVPLDERAPDGADFVGPEEIVRLARRYRDGLEPVGDMRRPGLVRRHGPPLPCRRILEARQAAVRAVVVGGHGRLAHREELVPDGQDARRTELRDLGPGELVDLGARFLVHLLVEIGGQGPGKVVPDRIEPLDDALALAVVGKRVNLGDAERCVPLQAVG
ncbi:MAG: hypothetical protein V9G18_09845 [Albidovulum sp.]